MPEPLTFTSLRGFDDETRGFPQDIVLRFEDQNGALLGDAITDVYIMQPNPFAGVPGSRVLIVALDIVPKEGSEGTC